MAESLFTEMTAELLRRGQSVRFSASGRSMCPTIREGEVITVSPVAPSEVGLADIILYRSGARVIAHRVVARQRGVEGMTAFLVRGDASENCDDPVAPTQILGKVVLVERAGRRIAVGKPGVKFFHLVCLLLHRLCSAQPRYTSPYY